MENPHYKPPKVMGKDIYDKLVETPEGKKEAIRLAKAFSLYLNDSPRRPLKVTEEGELIRI